MRSVLLILILVVSCGKHTSSHKTVEVRNEPIKPPPTQETTPEPTETPDDVNAADLVKINDLLPTMYYIPQEARTNCKGKYGGTDYNGSERSQILATDGSVIATVCTRFYRVLLMEGSAVLSNHFSGDVAVNVAGTVNGIRRFHILDRCTYGEGVKRDLCLLPYHTLATDNKVHAIGDIIFVPKAVGLLLPDGTKHEGYFIVRDTGGAFEGVGAQRVDMFTGLDPDYSNVFQRAGFHHKAPMNAFKIKGQSAEVIKDKLRARFGELY